MVLLNIFGVPIDFPFPPYGCQVKYMRSVIKCLQNRENGILESPTGTGKTLCLLCATLAWREKFAAEKQLSRINASLVKTEGHGSDKGSFTLQSEDSSTSFGNLEVPKIIYASRTHSQLSQAVNELKNTTYRPKVAVLGSRDHLCINPEVMKQTSNSAKVHMCRSKVNSRSCYFYNNLEAQKANKDVTEAILDIEDLANAGKKINTCPYYLSRELRSDADIIFMPYNYVLDLKSHKANGVELQNTILLLDEGHNVERVCEDSASFDLTSFDIACCIEECSTCLEILQQQSESEPTFGNESSSLKGSAVDLNANDVALVKAFFLNFEEAMDGIKIDDLKKGTTKPGSFILELLGKQNITMQSKDQVLEIIDQCNAFLGGQDNKIFKVKTFALQKFSDALKVVFSQMENNSRPTDNAFDDYRVHVHSRTDNRAKKAANVWTSSKKETSRESRTLSYWCFTPGKTMHGLLQKGVRSIILTSGTLSPLDSLKCELRIPFPVELQNSHVVSSEQFLVGVIKQGPDRVPLNSSYGNRFDQKYQESLGRTIINLARVVPHGLLVFFPSYPVMNLCVESWQNTNIWSMLGSIKALFIEPKSKDGFNEAMDNFYKCIQNPELKGAAFFAVCRGKVSEGLDFANNNGRAVVITGLPFPPVQDPKVSLKMDYLNRLKTTSRGTDVIGGQEWYVQQASRAVNQAIGRVIRHKKDFGVILLCDERFATERALGQLPKWIGSNINVYSEFKNVPKLIAGFFRNIRSKYGDEESLELVAQPVDGSANGKETNRISLSKGLVKGYNTTRKAGHVELNTEASQSLATLEANEASTSKGLFEQLNSDEPKVANCELMNTSTKPVAKVSPFISSSTNVDEKKSKRFKIVRKAAGTEDRERSCDRSETNADLNEKRVQENKQAASVFIVKMKKIMTKQSYRTFGTSIQTYKDTQDIHPLLHTLSTILDSHDYNPEDFADLQRFISRKSHLATFRQLIDKMKQKYSEKLRSETPDLTSSDSTQSKRQNNRDSDLDAKRQRLDKSHKEHTQKNSHDREFNEQKCMSCTQPVSSVVQGPCMHMFCRSCLQDAAGKSTFHCPVCKKPFRRKDLKEMKAQEE